MKNSCLLLVCLSLITIMPSCKKLIGKGPVLTENRTASPFQALSIELPAEAYFTQGPNYSIELRAQQNILDEIETVIIGNELKIRFRRPALSVHSQDQVAVYVTAPETRKLEVNGPGNLNVSPVTSSEMRLYISGSGSIHADNIQAGSIDAYISGSGNIKVNTGNANSETVRLSGSSYIDMGGVTVKDAEANISGSGIIKVNTSNSLYAKILGSGTVFYYGTPTITKNIMGSGSVVKL